MPISLLKSISIATAKINPITMAIILTGLCMFFIKYITEGKIPKSNAIPMPPTTPMAFKKTFGKSKTIIRVNHLTRGVEKNR